MKFTLALLVTLVVGGSSSVLRSRERHVEPKNRVEEEWSRTFPEISHPKIKERVFKDGAEYRYLYDSQILTGMPNVHYQFSGARIRAVVKIQLTGQKDLMQIEKVFVGSLHERFVSDPQTLVDLSAFEPLKEQDAPFEEVLRKPVRFSYENGKINDFEVTENDPTWSINIKRAIISTFHLSLTEREEPIDEVRREKLYKLSTSDNVVSGSKSSKPVSDKDSSEYFTVVEDSVSGRCEVSYLVMEMPNRDEVLYPIDDVTNQPAGQYDSPSPSDRREGSQPRRENPTPRRGPRAVPSEEDMPVLNVTKTFDRRHCEFRPFVYKGLHLSSACPNCEEDPESYFDLLEASAHTRYNITGTKEQYIIDSAISEAVYKITPRSHYAGSLVAYANITTVLIESGPMKQEIRFPEGQSVQIDGLHMINAHFLKREGDKVYYDSPETDKPILQKPEYFPNIAQKPQKVKALFEKLVHGMEPRENKNAEIDTDIALLVEDIIRFLDKAFVDELEQIHNAIKSVSAPGVQKEEIEHLFADLLVATGTNCTFTYLKKLLTEKHLQGPVVQDVLALMPFKMQTDKVNQVMIEEYMDMCEDEDLKNDPFVERACWLSFASLVHKACEHKWYGEKTWLDVVEKIEKVPTGESGRRFPARKPRQTGQRPSEGRYSDDMPPRCPPETRERIVQKVQDLLSNAESDEKKILAIKMMGNMGMNETIDELIAVAENDDLPVYIRTQAVYALKYVATDYPEMVYSSLLPLYRQTNQSTQVRIAVLGTILASRPDLPILEDIAQSLNREPDLDVASYTYSAMSSLANSTHPCLKNLTRDLILALEHAKPVNSDLRHSKSIHSGKYIDHMKRGLFWEVNHVMDRDAPVPRAGNFRLHATIMDKSFDLIEFGYETEGFGDSIRKYVGNYSRESMEEILSGHASRRPRSPPPTDSQTPEMEQIDSLLNMQPQPPKELRGTAYMKLFGQQTRFLVINPQTISRTLVDVISKSHNLIPQLTGEGLPMDQRRATTLMDVRVEFPTIMGVPIVGSVVAPVVASIKGKLKVQMEPKPAQGFSMLKNVPHKLLVESDVKTSVAGEIHSKMSVYLGFFKIGTGVRTRMSFTAPVSAKFEFNTQSRMTKVVLDMPETPFKLVNISSYPVTFVHTYSRNPTPYQPRPIPASHLGPRPHPDHESDESSEMPQRPRPTTPGPHREGFVSLNITETCTDMVTGNGHVVLSKLVGLPIPTRDIWEIPTPSFVKSRKVHFTAGHESIAAKVELKSKMEYPDTRIPTSLLPVVGAKCEMELKVTPNPGHKKVVITIFERSEFTHKLTEKDLLNKLKDKVTDMPIKEIEQRNPSMDRMAKMGHSLQILINSEGNESPEHWTTRGLLAMIYSMDGRFIKFIGGMNSKVPTLPKKFCVTAEVKKPERNGMWFVTPQESVNKSITGNLEASWGDECGSDKYVKLRLRYQKTKEQMEVEKYDLYNENGIPVPLDVAHEVREGEGLFNSLYKQCEEDRQRGAFFSKECVDFAIWYSDLLRLKFDIEYKDVSRPFKNVLAKLERLIKFKYFWNTDTKDVEVHNPENRMNAVIEFSADRSYMDIKYQTPRSNVSMINIDLPMEIQPISALVPWTPARLVGMAMYPACTISGPKIKTFDEVSDEMPLSECWHVMAKDATDEKLFAVLVAAAGKNTIAKKVAVIFPGHKIEILPTGSVSGSPQSPPKITSFVVKYNGQEMREAMTPEKYTTIPLNTPEEKEELATITLLKPEESGNKEPVLAIFSRPTGIKVLFDGSSVTVVPSPFWKNGLVGLCGTYDGQPWDDKLLPNKTLVEEPVEVSRAFLLNTRNCDQTIHEEPSNKVPKSRMP